MIAIFWPRASDVRRMTLHDTNVLLELMRAQPDPRVSLLAR